MSDFVQALFVFGIITIAIIAIVFGRNFHTKIDKDYSEIAIDDIKDKKE